MSIKKLITNTLKKAGININGNNPWDIKVVDERFYEDVASRGSLGFAEGYMKGWWKTESIDKLVYKLWKSGIGKKEKFGFLIKPFFVLRRLFTNTGSEKRSAEIGEKHYDAGIDLYSQMLGKYMAYSCGYWEKAKNLDRAQLDKMEMICKKLYLKPGMTVLDVGCGFGELLIYMVEKYKVKVVGVTVSKDQYKIAKEKCKNFNSSATVLFCDYRHIPKKYGLFDRIVSVGMAEHIGWKNYRTYMKTIHKKLKENGIFLLHTIGIDKESITTDPFIDKYIFPGSIIPSEKRLIRSMRELFVLQDWHNFGADYDKTLMAWFNNFQKNWGLIKNKYDNNFYRMWKFYLLSCAGAFRAEYVQLWQIVVTKKGAGVKYRSTRLYN
jgi:cyclopropane-fatty-acyl-phospholipid synthase